MGAELINHGLIVKVSNRKNLKHETALDDFFMEMQDFAAP
jgi:hypothetical protein